MNYNKLSFILACFVLIFGIFLLTNVSAQESENINCAVYFTSLNCPNCAVVDPVVLGDWPKKYENLVLIEYVFSGWSDENAQLLGQYSQAYESMSAVPNLFISENKNYLGRIDVPNAKDQFSNLDANPCLLLDKSVLFSELDLNELSANPKIWHNNRILIKSGEKQIPSNLLKELLLLEDLEKIISNSEYNIQAISPFPVPISDGEISFKKAISVEDSWILQYNDNLEINLNSNISNNSNIEQVNKSSQESKIDIPLIGEIDTSKNSLLLITILLGLADGCNPCAFFILTFLLAAMIYTASEIQDKRKKRIRIATVGFIFLFFSGLIYFLFMSLWLNVFLFAKEIVLLTTIAGVIAIFAGVINIKDYFYFQKGLSLTLPKQQKFKFQEKVEKLTKVKSFWLLILGTVIIAATVNMYELLCSVGFPMVYLGALASKGLEGASFYFYILLYNLCYIIPLAIIVVIFIVTLGKKEFGKKNVQRLKLISGLMVFLLGLILIFNPILLENILTPFLTIIASILIGLLVMYLREFRK